MSNNPYHNQHIQEYAAALEEATNEITQQNDGMFVSILEELDAVIARLEKLEQAAEKPMEIDADVRISSQSLKNLRAKIVSLLRG